MYEGEENFFLYIHLNLFTFLFVFLLLPLFHDDKLYNKGYWIPGITRKPKVY